MNFRLSVILFITILFIGCSPQVLDTISTSNPNINADSRRIKEVTNYSIDKKNGLSFSLKRNELVEYQSTITETKKVKYITIEPIYPLLYGFLAGGLPAGIGFTDASDWDTGKTLTYTAIGTAIGVTIGCLVGRRKAIRNKDFILSGPPIQKEEWVPAINNRFIVAINNKKANYKTDDTGKLKVDPYDFRYPVLTSHQDFTLSFSSGNIFDFATSDIHSSLWMKEYGIINSDPIKISSNLEIFFDVSDQLGAGSTIYDNRQGYSLLKINNNDTWIKPQFLNVFYYSSPNNLGNIPELRTLDYNKDKGEIINRQKEIIENSINQN